MAHSPFKEKALGPKRSDLFYVTVLVALLPPKSGVVFERYYGAAPLSRPSAFKIDTWPEDPILKKLK
jgi:hypothetical protein